MSNTKINSKQARINEIVQELRIIQTKIDIYAERDQFAASAHYAKYKALDLECLDLMTEVEELRKELPPAMPNEGTSHSVC